MAYLQLDDGVSEDENCNQDLVDEVSIVDIGGLMAMDEDSCFDNVDVLEGSFAPMDQTLAHSQYGMYYRCKRQIVRPCNITSSRNWIKHSPPLFGSNLQIHAPRNGILSGG
jgi:hypothetical protein